MTRIIVHDKAIRNELSKTPSDKWRVEQITKNILASGYGTFINNVGGLPVISLSTTRLIVAEKVSFPKEFPGYEVLCLFHIISDTGKCPGGVPNKVIEDLERSGVRRVRVSDDELKKTICKCMESARSVEEKKIDKPSLPKRFLGWIVSSDYKSTGQRDPLNMAVKETLIWRDNIKKAEGVLSEIHSHLAKFYEADFQGGDNLDGWLKTTINADVVKRTQGGAIYRFSSENTHNFIVVCELCNEDLENRELILIDIHEPISDDKELGRWVGEVVTTYLSRDEEGTGAYFPLIRCYLGRVFGGFLGDHKENANQMRKVWTEIETGDSESGRATICLSEEEENYLRQLIGRKDVRGESHAKNINTLPAFINGPAGSGKSTLLHYVFFHYWSLMHDARERNHYAGQPLFLTLNGNLLQTAKENILTMILLDPNAWESCESEVGHVLTDDEFRRMIENELSQSFMAFRDLMLQLLPEGKRERYKNRRESGKRRREVVFETFRGLFTGERDPQNCYKGNRAKWLTAELCWHVIRSYIKGYRGGEFLDDKSFKLLPESEKKDVFIEDSQYEHIYKHVWPWYRDLTSSNGEYYDQQDLAREVLDLMESGLASITKAFPGRDFTAVFCDEAQDLTGVELQIVQKISSLVQYNLSDVRRNEKSLPFVFAGDPMQTINPSGFRWENLTSNIYRNLLAPIASDLRPFPIRLQYNYRSPKEFTLFANLIQLFRYGVYDCRVSPQRPYKKSPGFPLVLEYDTHTITRDMLDAIRDGVILLPCSEDQDEEQNFIDHFINQNEWLRTLNAGERKPTFMSVMGAKGLDFPKVVLLGFGEEYFGESALETEMVRHTAKDIALSYKLNKCYVALTRSTEQMLILDTKRGFDNFWRRLYDDRSWRDALLDRMDGNGTGKRAEWEKYLPLAGLGTWDWKRPTDFTKLDPKGLEDTARAIFEDALVTKNSYGMSKAKNAYENLPSNITITVVSLGEKGEKRVEVRDQIVRCEAYVDWFNDHYPKAAKKFANIANAIDERVQCCWEGRLWKLLMECDGSLSTAQSTIGRLMLGLKDSKESVRGDAVRGFCEKVLANSVLVNSRDEDHWEEAFAAIASYVNAGMDSMPVSVDPKLLRKVADLFWGFKDKFTIGNLPAFRIFVNSAVKTNSESDWEHASDLRDRKLCHSASRELDLYDAHRAAWPEFLLPCKRQNLDALCYRRWKVSGKDGLSQSVASYDRTLIEWMENSVLLNNASKAELFDFAVQIEDRDKYLEMAKTDGILPFERRVFALEKIKDYQGPQQKDDFNTLLAKLLKDADSHDKLTAVLQVVENAVNIFERSDRGVLFDMINREITSPKTLDYFWLTIDDYEQVARIFDKSSMNQPIVTFAEFVLKSVRNDMLKARAAEALVFARWRYYREDPQAARRCIVEAETLINGLRSSGAKIKAFDELWQNAATIQIVCGTKALPAFEGGRATVVQGAKYDEENGCPLLWRKPIEVLDKSASERKVYLTNVRTEEKAVIDLNNWKKLGDVKAMNFDVSIEAGNILRLTYKKWEVPHGIVIKVG